MNHLFIPYNLARLAKKKGFDEQCFGYHEYKNSKVELFSTKSYTESCNSDLIGDDLKECTAILYQQIIDWFREKHNIHISVKSDLARVTSYQFIIATNSILNEYGILCNSYYKALNEGIEEAFKLI